MRKPFWIRGFVVAACWAVVLGGAVASAAVSPSGVAAHYIVFSTDAKGEIRPVFYQRVELAAAPVSRGEEELRREVEGKSRDAQIRAFALVDGGERTVFRGAATTSAWLRGEFHGEPQGSTRWSIDGHRFAETAPAFVVRLPIVAGARLVFDGSPAKGFDLDALAAAADRLPLAAMRALPSRVMAARRAVSSGNRVDLVILGDGYTAAQSGKFSADAASLEAQFFSITPYKEYRNFFNVTHLFTPSAQSGADHPPYLASCVADDPACCADPTMLSDPLRGTFVNTALGGRFCSFNIHRLAVVDDAAVLAAAAAVPDWDRLFVLLNDATYGGSGGSVSVSSLHVQSADIARHEFGHSFTGLADEYDAAFPGYPACSDISGGTRCEPNVTDQTSRAQIKWTPWIAASTPVPTPEGSPSFTHLPGLFEGARYLASGMYRHRDADCLMHFLGVPFGEVCAQEYVLRLYRGGWGAPAKGVDPIEPGSEVPEAGSTIHASTSTSVSFSVGVLGPIGGPPPAVGWWVDGTRVPAATGSSFTFVPPRPGAYTIEVRVHDATALVHPAMAGHDLDSSRRWKVVVRRGHE
jgi:hypothetical protein